VPAVSHQPGTLAPQTPPRVKQFFGSSHATTVPLPRYGLKVKGAETIGPMKFKVPGSVNAASQE